MNTADLPTQLRAMWATRPVRTKDGAIAGVATGFARRFNVDANLVRAAFVAAAVAGGGGVLAYIICWCTLSSDDKTAPQPSGPPAHRHGPAPIVLVVIAALAVIIGAPFGAGWPGAGLLSVALLIAGWWLLYQRTPRPLPGTSADTSADIGANPMARFAHSGWGAHLTDSHHVGAHGTRWAPRAWQQPEEAPTAATGIDLTKHDHPADADGAATPPSEPAPYAGFDSGVRQSPPVWDPLGTAPFAWDLPEPSTPQPVATVRRRTPVTRITLGAAIATTAVLSVLTLTGVVSLSSTVIALVALGIVVAGFVVAVFHRTGFGLFLVALALGGFVVLAGSMSSALSTFTDGPNGERHLTVPTISDLKPKYTLGAGSLQLDLTRTTLDRDRTLTTDVGFGETIITVPRDMNIVVSCATGLGSTNCPDGTDLGSDPKAPRLTIDAHTDVGALTVQRR